MSQFGRKFGKPEMIHATYRTARYFDEYTSKAELALADTEKAKRILQGQCRYCYYLQGRIGGSSITESECQLCAKALSFGNTCIDRLCLECSRRHKLCCHCGGDSELRTLRRKWPRRRVAGGGEA